MNEGGVRAWLTLAIRFASEVALVAAAAWAAAAHTRNVLAAITLGVVAAVTVAAMWGVWIAPASRRRLPDPARLVLELALFAAAVAGLALARHFLPAAVLGVVGAGAALGVRSIPEKPDDHRPADAHSNTAEPVSTEPVIAEPVSTEPVIAEPVTTEPVIAEPVTAEPDAPDSGAPAPLRRPRGRDRARPRR